MVVGRKIGLTSRGMMEMLNCDTPDYGYLLNTMMVREGQSCVHDRLHLPIIEGELAFIMGEDLKGPRFERARSYRRRYLERNRMGRALF